MDIVAEGDHLPLFTIPQLEPSDDERKIAALLLEEIEDGACLQLGIGGLPNMVGELVAQSDLKDLGVHSEMLADAHMKMFLSGGLQVSASAGSRQDGLCFCHGFQRII